jgi:hypothetical protein
VPLIRVSVKKQREALYRKQLADEKAARPAVSGRS